MIGGHKPGPAVLLVLPPTLYCSLESLQTLPSLHPNYGRGKEGVMGRGERGKTERGEGGEGRGEGRRKRRGRKGWRGEEKREGGEGRGREGRGRERRRGGMRERCQLHVYTCGPMRWSNNRCWQYKRNTSFTTQWGKCVAVSRPGATCISGAVCEELVGIEENFKRPPL